MHAILASAPWQKCGKSVANAEVNEVAMMGVVVRALMVHARRALCGCVVLLALGASGCSTIDFAYSMGPTALTLMADNYLDLDGEQETGLKERLVALREWHRTGPMAEYATLLMEVRSRAGGRISSEDLAWLTDEGRKRWQVVAARVAADIVEIAPRLTAENVSALKKKLARNNAEYTKESIEAPLEKQRERRFERFKENIDRWYGNLEEAQLERLRVLSDALPANPRLVLEDRIRRQEAFVATLATAIEGKVPRDAVRARLVLLLTDWEHGRSPAYQAFASAWLRQSRALAVEIVNMATPAQRETAQRRFKRWADDFAALAARKEP